MPEPILDPLDALKAIRVFLDTIHPDTPRSLVDKTLREIEGVVDNALPSRLKRTSSKTP